MLGNRADYSVLANIENTTGVSNTTANDSYAEDLFSSIWYSSSVAIFEHEGFRTTICVFTGITLLSPASKACFKDVGAGVIWAENFCKIRHFKNVAHCQSWYILTIRDTLGNTHLAHYQRAKVRVLVYQEKSCMACSAHCLAHAQVVGKVIPVAFLHCHWGVIAGVLFGQICLTWR